MIKFKTREEILADIFVSNKFEWLFLVTGLAILLYTAFIIKNEKTEYIENAVPFSFAS